MIILTASWMKAKCACSQVKKSAAVLSETIYWKWVLLRLSAILSEIFTNFVINDAVTLLFFLSWIELEAIISLGSVHFNGNISKTIEANCKRFKQSHSLPRLYLQEWKVIFVMNKWHLIRNWTHRCSSTFSIVIRMEALSHPTLSMQFQCNFECVFQSTLLAAYLVTYRFLNVEIRFKENNKKRGGNSKSRIWTISHILAFSCYTHV